MTSYQTVSRVPLLILATKGNTSHLQIYNTQIEFPFPLNNSPFCHPFSNLVPTLGLRIQWDPLQMQALTLKQAIYMPKPAVPQNDSSKGLD